MILSDSVILKEIENKNIIIEPFNRELLNPGSLDIRLGDRVKVYTREFVQCDYDDIPSMYNLGAVKCKNGLYWEYEKALDPKDNNPCIELMIPDNGMILQPGEVYLYSAFEKIGIKGNIGCDTKGKSSLGRLGLDIVIGPCGWVDPGFEGSLVLELRATRPIIVYKNMKIAQLVFHRLEGEVLESYGDKKGSKYMNQEGVQQSLYHLNYK